MSYHVIILDFNPITPVVVDQGGVFRTPKPELKKVVRRSASRNSKGCAFLRSLIKYAPIFFTIKNVQPIGTKKIV